VLTTKHEYDWNTTLSMLVFATALTLSYIIPIVGGQTIKGDTSGLTGKPHEPFDHKKKKINRRDRSKTGTKNRNGNQDKDEPKRLVAHALVLRR